MFHERPQLSPSSLSPFPVLSPTPQASGNYRIASLYPWLIPGMLLPDTEQGLVAEAFEKNYSVIASYSAIPASAHITLEIQGHGEDPVSQGWVRCQGSGEGVPPPLLSFPCLPAPQRWTGRSL